MPQEAEREQLEEEREDRLARIRAQIPRVCVEPLPSNPDSLPPAHTHALRAGVPQVKVTVADDPSRHLGAIAAHQNPFDAYDINMQKGALFRPVNGCGAYPLLWALNPPPWESRIMKLCLTGINWKLVSTGTNYKKLEVLSVDRSTIYRVY
eukprot:362646-Prorocentrum_minimum.AAC.7